VTQARLNLNERELGVLAEALREALAGEPDTATAR